MGNLSHWDTSGDWNVNDGGHHAEKCFASSYMECNKEQIILLTDNFTAEYLDTAPEIQV